MTPSERSMPVIEARARGSEWIVRLPGGRYLVRPSETAVRRLVAAEAPGSAIAFLPVLDALRSAVDTVPPPGDRQPSGARAGASTPSGEAEALNPASPAPHTRPSTAAAAGGA
jgi:hypothetical protein